MAWGGRIRTEEDDRRRAAQEQDERTQFFQPIGNGEYIFEFIPSGSYQVPRIGESVRYDGSFYEVTTVIHDLEVFNVVGGLSTSRRPTVIVKRV